MPTSSDEPCTVTEVRVLRVEVMSLRELVDRTREGDMKALQLQAAEYQRRLEDLNHAHKVTADRNAMFVSRELHDVEFRRVAVEYAALSRMVYIGFGILLAVNALLFLVEGMISGK